MHLKSGNPMNQSEIFKSDEGDAWFARNKSALERLDLNSELEPLLKFLAPFKNQVNSILEIGSSDGRRLEYICDHLRVDGVGIDPSDLATQSGNLRFREQLKPHIKLISGEAQMLPFPESSFDLVFFGFCLYLIDREHLAAAVKEADRVLKSGGFLIILDFDVKSPITIPYHHKAGINSYKEDYSQYFLNHKNYHLAYKNSFGHNVPDFQIDKDERIAYSVLYKDFTP